MTAHSILNLDNGRALDPTVVGAKAATLAAARRAGLPVLPGFAVAVGTEYEALALAEAALANGNSGRARLAVVDHELPNGLSRRLVAAAARLGGQVVVRSSSPIEGEAVWSGAFASYAQIAPPEVPIAVVGCWASWFTEDALRRAAASGVRPREVGMAVLVQPEIIPDAGGVARVDGDGTVVVTGIEGAPAAIVSGWEKGHTAVVDTDGTVSGEDARGRFGDELIATVADLTRQATSILKRNLIEWAWSDGTVWLLQAARTAPRRSSIPVGPAMVADQRLMRVVRLVVNHPGPIGDAFVLPWALGSAPPKFGGSLVKGEQVHDMLERTRQLAAKLTARSWAIPEAGSYRETRLALQEPDPGPGLDLLERLNQGDRDHAAEVLELLESIAGELSKRGQLPAPAWIWHLRPDELRTLVECGVPRDASRRIIVGAWEPFLFAAIRALSPPVSAERVVPGTGAGRLSLIRTADDAEALAPRTIVAAMYPLNNLAPLLFDAAGFMTIGGNDSAHVFEVAASLRVPSVCGVDLEAATGLSLAEIRTRRDIVAAIDGTAADISILKLGDRV